MNNLKNIRWQQRFSNLKKAFELLTEAVNVAGELDTLAKEGLIQRFEYTFELSWKTLKDYLESQGEQENSPRNVIKKAFQYNMIDNGELWLEMLDNRNILAHTYNENYFEIVFNSILNEYFYQIKQLVIFFDEQ